MDDQDWLAERFEEKRTHLRAVAYRMLGSLSEADDAVQEAWLRLSRSDTSSVENLGGWLTTVVARVCLDMLRARRSGAVTRKFRILRAHGLIEKLPHTQRYRVRSKGRHTLAALLAARAADTSKLTKAA
jgi:DNA-directed RNA polymerase specialized sigma24 family protein